MNDFATRFVTSWKDGAYFDYTRATVIVSYDQRNDAYDVDPSEREAFEVWALDVFGGDEAEPDEIAIRWL